MKIRNGFVSNSSSSSFVVSCSDYPTVRSLAIEMLKIRNDDYDNYDNELATLTMKHTETNDQKILDKIKNQLNYKLGLEKEIIDITKSTCDPDISLAFVTCNYDTYIMKYNDYIFVSTCNNHSWGLSNKINPTTIPQDVFIKLFGKDMYDEYCPHYDDLIEHSLPRIGSFLWTKHNIFIRKMNDWKRCNVSMHLGIMLMSKDGINFEEKCPMCEFGEEIG